MKTSNNTNIQDLVGETINEEIIKLFVDAKSFTDLFPKLNQIVENMKKDNSSDYKNKLKVYDLLLKVLNFIFVSKDKEMLNKDQDVRVFTDGEIQLLSSISHKLPGCILKTIMTDLVWKKTIDVKYLRFVATSSLDTIKNINQLNKNIFNMDIKNCARVGINRLVMLSGDSKAQLKQIEDELFILFDSFSNKSMYEAIDVADLMLESKMSRDKAKYFYQNLKLFSKHLSNDEQFSIKFEKCLNLAHEWFKLVPANKNKVDADICNQLSDGYKILALEEIRKKNGMGAQLHINKAIIHLNSVPKYQRNINNHQGRMKILNGLNSEAKKLTPNQFISYSFQAGIPEVIKNTNYKIEESKSTEEALVVYSNICPLNKIKLFTQSAADIIENSLALNVTNSLKLSHDGRIIDNKNLSSSDAHELVACTMVHSFIIPGLKKLRSSIKNKFTEKDIIDTVSLSSIVPKNRINTVSRAICLGFQLDFTTSIHLLIPQLENILRQLVKKHEVTTVKSRDGAGIENEISLCRLIEKMKENKALLRNSTLNEALINELDSVFCNKAKGNLRNDIVHGLLDDNYIRENHYVMYAWWLVLHIVVNSIPAEK